MGELASLLLRHPLHAALAAGVLGALSLIFLPAAVLSAAILALVALRHGMLIAIVIAAGALILVGAGWLVVNLRPGLAFPIVLALWVPVLAGAWTLRVFRSQGLAVLAVGSICLFWVLAMHVLTGDVEAFWRDWLARAVTGVPGATVQGFERDGTLPLMNGLVAFAMGVGAMLSLLLARWMQSLVYYPGGFGQEFRDLRLPVRVTVLVALVLLAVSAFSQVLMSDLLLVALMMYLFVGLAVIHGIVAQRRLSWLWVAPPYVLIAMVPQYAALGLAMLGALDGFMRFRTQARRMW